MTTEFRHDPQVNVYNTASWLNGFTDITDQMARDAAKDNDIDRLYDMIRAQLEINRLRKERFRWR